MKTFLRKTYDFWQTDRAANSKKKAYIDVMKKDGLECLWNVIRPAAKLPGKIPANARAIRKRLRVALRTPEQIAKVAAKIEAAKPIRPECNLTLAELDAMGQNSSVWIGIKNFKPLTLPKP